MATQTTGEKPGKNSRFRPSRRLAGNIYGSLVQKMLIFPKKTAFFTTSFFFYNFFFQYDKS
jgi:hypothetical protein